MKSPFPHFFLDELKCRCGTCGSDGLEMNVDFMARIVDLRKDCGFSFPVTSAYRCPAYNARVSGSGLSGPHTTGKAMDIAVSRKEAFVLLAKAFDYGFSGIGIQQKGQGRFIHLDCLTEDEAMPRPTVWSY